MKQLCIYILLILLTIILPFDSQAKSSPATTEEYCVLCIQSSDNPYLINERRKLVEKAFSEADIPVDLHYILLRTHDVESSYSMDVLLENLNAYNETPPDVILTFNDDALNFLMACAHPLVQQTSIVFSNVIVPLDLMKNYPRITGQLETINYR